MSAVQQAPLAARQPQQPPTEGDQRPVTPWVRARARALGVALDPLRARGAGRVTVAEVEAAAAASTSATSDVTGDHRHPEDVSCGATMAELTLDAAAGAGEVAHALLRALKELGTPHAVRLRHADGAASRWLDAAEAGDLSPEGLASRLPVSTCPAGSAAEGRNGLVLHDLAGTGIRRAAPAVEPGNVVAVLGDAETAVRPVSVDGHLALVPVTTRTLVLFASPGGVDALRWARVFSASGDHLIAGAPARS
ncbi:hypothetical protein [Nocardioides pantholopis]|uniref:hypothetical protein n=1 Tax=Nocardioides pantholopis TaxID=2483798 RepID=UPI000F094872|nr:hypothetical protein [Nocardioides pantholopis]